jgi:hypothetical protein
MSYRNTPRFLYSELLHILIAENVETESKVQIAGSNHVGTATPDNLMNIIKLFLFFTRRRDKTDMFLRQPSESSSHSLERYAA